MAESKLRTLSVDFAIQILNKLNKKKWLIHGIILLSMIIACCFNFQLIILWNLGYAVYFMGKVITQCTRDIKQRLLKILTVILLAIGSAPCVMFMLIPSWFLCVVHSIQNPEYAENLPTYNCRGIQLRNGAYYKDYNNYHFEGDIEEEALKKAAILQDWKFEEITKKIAVDYTAGSAIKYHKNKIRFNDTIYIDDGLIYNSRKNTDCGDFVVYDRKNKRLYFYSTLR